MKYFSTFSGIGGFELGIQQAYEDNNIIQKLQRKVRLNKTGVRSKRNIGCTVSSNGNGRGVYPTCIGYSEIDKYAIQIYQKHFNHKNYGDITKINAKELPDFELLVGGFPCQAFSIAGRRGGFNDTRGTLFFDIARIIREKQPRLFLLENVKGLLSHDKGSTFRTIISTLDELGYDLQWQVLNSKNHGVPQNRERVFIIGHLRGTSRPKVFPFGGTDNEDTKKVIQTNPSKESGGVQPYQQNRIYDKDGLSPALPAELGGDRNHLIQLNNPKHSNDRVYGAEGISPTLNTMQGGRRQPFVSVKLEGYGGKVKLTEAKDDIAYTLRATEGGSSKPFIKGGSQIRRLTPTECERLQGFSDGWTKFGKTGLMKPKDIGRNYPQYSDEVEISDTQRYKTLGNAVTVNVVKAIMDKLIK